MRDIKFKGYCMENKEWLYGGLFISKETTYCCKEDYVAHPENTKAYILFDQMTDWGLPNNHYKVEVNPKSVGQYIGKKDKNSKEIYEGDIVIGSFNGRGIIIFDEEKCQFLIKTLEYKDVFAFDNERFGMIEVIGNIYDNPELLEAE